MFKRLALAAYVSGTILWALLSYASLYDYISHGDLFARTIGGRPYISDFVNHYSAGGLARKALQERINIYDPVIQDAAVRALVAPVVPELPFYLQYPPQFFVMVLPLALMSMLVAWFLWSMILLTASAVSLRLLTPDLDRRTSILVIVLSFATSPFWLSVELGQTSLLLFPLVTMFFIFLKQSRPIHAGVAVALLSIKLQYLPAFALVGLMVGRAKFLASLAAALTVMLGLSVAVLGWDNVMRFPSALALGETSKQFSGVSPEVMQNLRGELCLLMSGDGNTHTLVIIGYVASLLAVGWLWRRKPASDTQFDLVAGITVLLAIAFSVHVHAQDYVVLCLPCIFLFQRINPIPPAERTKLQKVLFSISFVYPALSWVLFLAQPSFRVLLIQPFFLLAIILLPLIVLEQRKYSGGGASRENATDH